MRGEAVQVGERRSKKPTRGMIRVQHAASHIVQSDWRLSLRRLSLRLRRSRGGSPHLGGNRLVSVCTDFDCLLGREPEEVKEVEADGHVRVVRAHMGATEDGGLRHVVVAAVNGSSLKRAKSG